MRCGGAGKQKDIRKLDIQGRHSLHLTNTQNWGWRHCRDHPPLLISQKSNTQAMFICWWQRRKKERKNPRFHPRFHPHTDIRLMFDDSFNIIMEPVHLGLCCKFPSWTPRYATVFDTPSHKDEPIPAKESQPIISNYLSFASGKSFQF